MTTYKDHAAYGPSERAMRVDDALRTVEARSRILEDVAQEQAEMRARRNTAIVEAHAAGATWKQLQIAAGLTPRAVAMILGKAGDGGA
jgi:DNA-binding protein H-NS